MRLTLDRQEINVLAAQDSGYSLYDKKSKGSFGAKKTKRRLPGSMGECKACAQSSDNH